MEEIRRFSPGLLAAIAKRDEMLAAQKQLARVKEASTFAPPELSRAERRRLQRDRKHMKGLRP